MAADGRKHCKPSCLLWRCLFWKYCYGWQPDWSQFAFLLTVFLSAKLEVISIICSDMFALSLEIAWLAAGVIWTMERERCTHMSVACPSRSDNNTIRVLFTPEINFPNESLSFQMLVRATFPTSMTQILSCFSCTKYKSCINVSQMDVLPSCVDRCRRKPRYLRKETKSVCPFKFSMHTYL